MSERCPKCGAYQSHSYTCPDLTLEEAREMLIRCSEATVQCMNLASRHRMQTVFWQGKFNMVRHENNRLRRQGGMQDMAFAMLAKLLEEGSEESFKELRERFARWREARKQGTSPTSSKSGPAESGQ